MLEFRVATGLGYPHPDQIKCQLSHFQWRELLAFYTLEPFGEDRADLRNGILCSLLGNINRKKGAKKFRPSDFMPFLQKPKQSVNQMMNICKAIAAAFDAKAQPQPPEPVKSLPAPATSKRPVRNRK